MRLRQLTALLALAPAAAGAVELDSLELRLVVFDQEGRGFQSPADPDAAGRGSEEALIVAPMFRAVFDSGANWKHDVIFMVDVVSAASPDAIDAVSTASAVNEAGALEVTSTWSAPGGQHRLSIRAGAHVEEPLRSGSLGASYALRLAEGNTVIEGSVLGSYDSFNAYGFRPGPRRVEDRGALNTNLSLRQILSPTTVADLAYGYTLQRGTLQTTYNSVPLDGDGRAGELFPSERHRHAVSARLAQHLPATRTTLKGLYRIYGDDFGLRAHTVELQGYQFVAPWLYLRGGYRRHRQSGVDFYGESFADAPPAPRTADSDLGPFTAHELDLKVAFLGERAPFRALARKLIDVSVARYWRSNGLAVMVVSLALGERF